jgi:predicted metal-binding membrane protein
VARQVLGDRRGELDQLRLTAVERLLRRDRVMAAIGLFGATALAWASLFRMHSGMGSMGGAGMAMPGMQAWSPLEPLLLLLMWATMMVAMMLPSAAPTILLVASVLRRRREHASPAAPTAVFVAGYLVVWTGFSAAAALAQWGLHEAALLSPAMASTSPVLGGILLLAAGVYQWLPAKAACLHHCRSPLGFLGSHWREGGRGALAMGMTHGLYCLGCCWALMLLLFVAGVMNLLWVAAIAALVLVEKVVPAGPWVSRVAGLAMAGWGLWMLA